MTAEAAPVYLDASALVMLLVPEEGSDALNQAPTPVA
jgi:predicted nucleic acid-binding protein